MASTEEINEANNYKKEQRDDVEEDEETIKEFFTKDLVAFETILSWIERVPMLCIIFLSRFPLCIRFAAELLTVTNLIFAIIFIGRLLLYPSAIGIDNLFFKERIAFLFTILIYHFEYSRYHKIATAIFVVTNGARIVNNWSSIMEQVLSAVSCLSSFYHLSLCNREVSDESDDAEDDEPRKKKQAILQESNAEFSDEEEAKSYLEEEDAHNGAGFLGDKKCLGDSKLEVHCLKLEEENYVLTLRLYAATEALKQYRGIKTSFAEHRVKWDEEKKDIAAKLHDSVETLRHCQQEKKDLAAKLSDTVETLRNYQHIVNDCHFEDQRKWEKETYNIWSELDASAANVANAAAAAAAANHPASTNDRERMCAALLMEENNKLRCNWEQERNDLTAKLTATSAWYQYYVHAAYDYQLQNHNLLVERNDLSVKLQSANTSAEFYKACLDDSDDECRKLREESNNLSAKLFAETSSAEHYHKLVKEMEEKCRKFQEEKNELVTKLCAAKAASQLYRSYLHDIGS